MTIERITDFALMADRYRYDCGKCAGWAQIDTKQDASYYGTWTDPDKREIFTYCEGDTNLVRCSTDDEYKQELLSIINWNKENGCWLGIDPGWPDRPNTIRITERLTALGLGEYLH